MSSPRLVRAVAGGALVLLLVGLGGAAYATLRVRPLAARLVADARALEGLRPPRPSHVTPPAPGTVAERLEPLMGELLRLYRARSAPFLSGASDFPCLGVIEGREPASALPPACREEREKGRELVARALAATRTEAGGLPEQLRGDAAPLSDTEPGPRVLLYVLRRAALETRLLLTEGRVAEAVDTCLDALALGRELALDGVLTGQVAFAAGMRLVYRPCAEALDVASVGRKRSAAGQLSRLAEGFPPLSRVLRSEAVAAQLTAFGGLMPGDLRALLPERARRLATPAAGPAAPLQALSARLGWRRVVTVYDALIAAADRAPPARKRAFLEADATRGAELDAAAERLDVARLQQEALLALVEVDLRRAEEGRWPTRPTRRPHADFTLEATSPVEALLKPCAPGQSQQALRVTADGWARSTP